MDERFSLDAAVVRRSFNKASRGFDAAAVLHREVRQRALQRLLLLRKKPEVILDLGAGTCHASAWLTAQYPGAHVIAIDNALAMLSKSLQLNPWQRLFKRPFKRVCADAISLPLCDGSVDWVFSNLMLPWNSSIGAVLAEIRRVLTPGGLFSFSTFGPDTLHELREAWRHVDSFEHIHPFMDMHDLGDALVHEGFSEPVLDVEHFTLTYSDAKTLLADLKATGSCNALPNRPRGLTGRNKFTKLAMAYEALRIDAKLPATYEVVYGQGWKALAARAARYGGETRVPVKDIPIRQK